MTDSNNPALENAHKIAQKKGFKGDINSFKTLISTNEGALGDVYNSVRSQGYEKDINSFKALVGISDVPKKKKVSSSTSGSQNSDLEHQTGSSAGNGSDIIAKNNEKARSIPKGTKFRLPTEEEVEKSNASEKKVNKPGDISLVTAKQVGAKPKTKQEVDKQISDSYSMDENQLIKPAPENEFSKFADFNASPENRQVLKSALEKHDQETTVDETFINDAVAEAEEIAGGNNTWENVKSGAKGMFNTWLLQNPAISGIAEKMGVNPYQNTDPLAEEKTKERKRLIDSGVDPKKINDADVLNGAKKIYVENKVADKKLSLSNDFYENLSDSEKDALELKFTYDKGKLSTEDNRLIQNLKITKARIKDLTFDAQPILAKLKNKEQITPEEYKIVEDLDKQIITHNNIYDDYQSNSKGLLSAAEELDLVKREYGEVQNFVADVGTAGLKIGLGALQSAKTSIIGADAIMSLAGEFIPGASDLGAELDKGLGKAQSELENWNQNNFRKNTDEIHNVNDGINFVTDLIGNQAPNIGIMLATGGGSTIATKLGIEGNKLAIGAIGAYSYGNKKNELNNSNATGETNYTKVQTELAAILYGGSEMFETATLGALGKTKRFIGASLAEEPTRELFRKSIKDKFISGLKSGSKDIKGENIEEQVTNLIQNWTEKNVLGREDVGLFDNAGDVLKSATAMALLLKAPQFAGAVAKKFQPKQYNDVLDNNAKEVLSLFNELKKDGLTPETKKVINDRIAKLSNESDAIVKKTFERISKLPAEQIDKVVELEKSTADLRAKAQSIKNDESLSEETKENLIKDLSSQFKTQEDLRTKIVSEKATILDILPENEVVDLKKKAVESLLTESEGTNEANYTEEKIDAKAVELYNNSKDVPDTNVVNIKGENEIVRDSSNISQNPEVVVSPTNEVNNSETPENTNTTPTENEATPSQDIIDDGNIRPSDAVVDQNGSANEGDNQGSVQQPTELQGDNGQKIERSVKVSDSGQDYNVVFENGNMSITDNNGKAPSKPTERKVLEKYSDTINFTQGKKSIEAENVNMNDYENMVLEHSENPVEIAEAISFVNQKDFSENRSPIDNAIAEIISSKGVDKKSFIQFGDRNNINQSIAMQYFAKKGKGSAIDMIAMDAEYEYFGDYDANNPRITTQDVVDFIMNNQKGVDSFLNSERNGLIKQLGEKFTKLTGLPANDKYIEKALSQELEYNNRIYNNNESLYAMSEEELLSLSNDLDTAYNNNTKQDGGKKTNTSNESSINSENSEGSSGESRIQETRRAEDPGIEKQTAEQSEIEVEPSALDNILNQDNVSDVLDWLDDFKLDPNDLKVTLPFLPQTWNAFIDAIKLSVKAGNTLSKAIQEGIKALEALGTSKTEIDAIVDTFNKKANQEVKDNGGTFTRKSGKKSLLSRLRNGNNDQKVIDALEKEPLNYEVRNQEEANKLAVEFVDKHGTVEAYNAIKNNLIENMDMKALIYNEILQRMPAEIDAELEGISDNAEYSKTQEELYTEFAKISSEFSDFATNLGQGISILNFIYNQNQDLQYELSKQVDRHKATNNGEISPETLAKFEEADKKIKELSKKIAEAEKKLNEAEEQLAVNNIVEQLARAKNPKATNTVLPSAKAKALADKLRSLKIGNRPGAFRSSVGADVVWDSAVEITAKAIETTGDITQAVQKGLKVIRESDWYKNLTNNEKAEAEFGFTEFFIDNYEVEKEQEFARYDKTGKLIIPPSLIKKYVSEGFNKIDTLTEIIIDDLENSGFNPTEREVRDAITGYGKKAGKTRSEIDIEIAKVKTLGKLISKLEDLQDGITKTKSETQKT